MARILTLGEASGISENDDILVDSPTLGSRRIKAKYFQGGDPVLAEKTITENGIYNASTDNADGYSTVSVNVSGGANPNRLVVYNKFNKDTYAQFRYTAETDCIMIAFNALVNNAANTYSQMGSYISTTGTVISTDSISDGYNSSNFTRNQSTVCKIIRLSQGNTVTFSNDIPANMIDAIHIGIIINFEVTAFSKIEYSVLADNHLSMGSISIPTNGNYLLISCVLAGNNNIGRYTISHPNNETILFPPIANDALVARTKPTIFTANANDSIDYDFATFINYVSKGYYLYKLT